MKFEFISKKSLLSVWVALLFLLALTWGIAQLNLGAANTTVAMGIAGVKVALVVLFFMQLKYNSRTTWIFAGAGLVWLMIMFALTLGDYLTRASAPGNRNVIEHAAIQSP